MNPSQNKGDCATSILKREKEIWDGRDGELTYNVTNGPPIGIPASGISIASSKINSIGSDVCFRQSREIVIVSSIYKRITKDKRRS